MRKSFLKFFIVFSLSVLVFNTTFSQAKSSADDSTKVDTLEEKGFGSRINDAFVPIVKGLGSVLFYDPFSSTGIYNPVIYDDNGSPIKDNKGNPLTSPIPFIVVWLILGAIFFTVFMKFINIKGFGHAIALIRGKYDKPDDKGEVSHFQALATALSATVGLGNIAGVAIAIAVGGPGATFWMIIAGFLGMSAKFVECTLGVKYRKIDIDGVVSGGPMYYLSNGLKKYKMGGFGAVLAVVFAILVIGASFGGGNMFQANQAFIQMENMFPVLEGQGFWFGLVIAILVGIVIIGGIKSIARVTDKIVPFMAVLYVVAALVVIVISYDKLGHAISLIFEGAFAPSALKGGVIGVLIMGFRRAAFSNEAGVGSAAIAHSAVKTEEPISEGIVALLEPFIDTVVICTMTALVIVITGEYTNFAGDTSNEAGVQLTSAAFGSIISWFPYVLTLAVLLFAFSTMISWSYYGLKGFDFLFGKGFEKVFGNRKIANTVYRVLFLAFVIIGTCSNMTSVVDFSDMMILCMAFPNIIGLIILAPEVRRDLKSYFARIKTGEIKRYK